MRLALLITAICTLSCISRAMSAVVLHDNSAGLFLLIPNEFGSTAAGSLDPTLGPSAQTSIVSPFGIGYRFVLGGGSETIITDGFQSGASIRLATEAVPQTFVNRNGLVFSYAFASTFAPGSQIDAAQNYTAGPSAALFYVGGGRIHEPFLGQRPTIGFRADLPDGPHFGWIELDFRVTILPNGSGARMYQPVRWAYETEPNVPITVVPSPAGAAALGLGAILVARRRRLA